MFLRLLNRYVSEEHTRTTLISRIYRCSLTIYSDDCSSSLPQSAHGSISV